MLPLLLLLLLRLRLRLLLLSLSLSLVWIAEFAGRPGLTRPLALPLPPLLLLPRLLGPVLVHPQQLVLPQIRRRLHLVPRRLPLPPPWPPALPSAQLCLRGAGERGYDPGQGLESAFRGGRPSPAAGESRFAYSRTIPMVYPTAAVS